jgi:RNA polymerase sigma factor (sigma-70 family)
LKIKTTDEKAIGGDLRYALHQISENEWEDFVTRISLRVYKFFGTSKEDSRRVAYDVLNAVVEKALKKAENFDPQKGNAIQWLHGFVQYELLHRKRDGYYVGDVQRHNKTERVKLEDETTEDVFAKLGKSNLSAEGESDYVLNEIISQNFNEQEQAVLKLYSEGYTAQEIAEKQGKAIGATYTQLSRLRKKLKGLIAD